MASLEEDDINARLAAANPRPGIDPETENALLRARIQEIEAKAVLVGRVVIVRELRARAEAAERETAEVCRWIEFGRRLAHEQATMILTLQLRVANQRHQLSWLHTLYEDKLLKTGIGEWGKRCDERYRMLRGHYQDLAAERNALKLRAESAEAALGEAELFRFYSPTRELLVIVERRMGSYWRLTRKQPAHGMIPTTWVIAGRFDDLGEALAAARKLAGKP